MVDAKAEAASTGGRWTLLVTILASSVVFADMTIVNLALPVMQREFDATFSTLQWVVEAYVLLLCALMLTGGGLADRFGRRRVLCAGAWMFGLASLMAATAPDSHWLIAARALQGIGGALLAPASLALVSAAFADGQRGRAFGIWAAFSGVATAFAPPVGGLLMELWSWRAAFYVNLPVIVIILIVAPWRVPESRARDADSQLDWRGAALAIVTLGAFTYALLSAGELGLGASRVVVALLVALCGGLAFIAVEQRVDHPMLPLALFRSRVFTGLNVMTLVLFTAVGAVMFFLPMLLMQAYGYSPLQAGAAVIPSMLTMFVVSPAIGKWADRNGTRIPLMVGPWVSAAAYVLLANQTSSYYWDGLWFAIVMMGLGFGLWVTPLTTAVMSSVGAEHSGIASGINNAVARMAQLVAIAIMGLVAGLAFRTELAQALPGSGLGRGIATELMNGAHKLGALQAPGPATGAEESIIKDLVRDSFAQAFGVVAYVSASLCVVASALGAWAMGGSLNGVHDR
ncbi:MAG: MFS transporter [Pseudomonadota bacterium]